VAVVTREKICSLVIPGEAIATPCDVQSTPMERGDEQRRHATMPGYDHPGVRSYASAVARYRGTAS
jgi:hypothetical protein